MEAEKGNMGLSKKKMVLFAAMTMIIGSLMVTSVLWSDDNDSSAAVRGDFEYEFTGASTVEITRYYGSDNDVTVPGSFRAEGAGRKVTVTSIGEEAFNGNDRIERVTIQEGVRTIGESAFYGCSNLTDINLPNSLTRICSNAFTESGLTTVTIPENVTAIDPSAFARCESLQNVTIESTYLDRINSNVFDCCISLETIAIPSSVKTIYGYAFYGCSSLYDVTFIGAALESIHACAFYETALYDIDLPASVRYIDILAFDHTEIKVVAVPSAAVVMSDAFPADASLIRYSGPISFINAYEYDPNTIRVDITPIEGSDAENVVVSNTVGGTPITATPLESEHISRTFPAGADITLELTYAEPAFTVGYVNETVTITGGTNITGSIDLTGVGLKNIITGNTDPARAIGEDAFKGITKITSLIIPDNIAMIEDGAFAGCVNIKELTIPITTTIHPGAFTGCVNIEKLNFTGIGSGINYDDYSILSMPWYLSRSKLTTVSFTPTITHIGHYTLFGCNNVDTLSFSKNAVMFSVGDDAFNSTSISSFPFSRVNEIGDSAFYGTQFVTLNIPASVSTIGWRAFAYCMELLSVNISDNTLLRVIERDTFDGSENLTTIDIPSNIRAIKDNAFTSTNIEFIVVSELTEVGDVGDIIVFTYLGSIVDMDVTKTGTAVTIEFEPLDTDNPIEELRVFSDGGTIPAVLTGTTGTFTIGSTDKHIDVHITHAYPGVKYELKGTTVVVTGGNMISGDLVIDDMRFEGSMLRTVTSIEANAFFGNTDITSVKLPMNLLTIEDGAFAGCVNIKEITIPIFTVIAEGAFTGCVNIERINFTGLSSKGNGVEFASSSAVQNMPWQISKAKLETITFDANVVSIGDYMFLDCNALRTITIADNSKLTKIGSSAFNGTGITSIALPASLTTLGVNAFSNSGLEIITVADANTNFKAVDNILMTKDGKTLIRYPFGSSTARIPSSVEKIGSYAFYGVDDFNKLVIDGNVTVIENGAFWGCASLEYATITSPLAAIGNNAFQLCAALVSITLPATVSNIGSGAFTGCDSLAIAAIPAAVVSNPFPTSTVVVRYTGSVNSVTASLNDGSVSLNLRIPEGITTSSVKYGTSAPPADNATGSEDNWTFPAGTAKEFFVDIVSGTYSVVLPVMSGVSYEYSIDEGDIETTDGGVIFAPAGKTVTIGVVCDTTRYAVDTTLANTNGAASENLAIVIDTNTLIVTLTGKTYDVTIDECLHGTSVSSYSLTATYGVDYTFTVAAAGAGVPVGTVMINGEYVNVTADGLNYTVSGADILGDIAILVTLMHTVSLQTGGGALEYSISDGPKIPYDGEFLAEFGSIVELFPGTLTGHTFQSFCGSTVPGDSDWLEETVVTVNADVLLRFKADQYDVDKTANVVSGITVTSLNDKATHGLNYVFNISTTLSIEVTATVGGESVDVVKEGTIKYTIAAKDVTGEIVITVVKLFTITFEDGNGSVTYAINGSGNTPFTDQIRLTSNDSIEFIPDANKGYKLMTSMTAGASWSDDLEFDPITSDILLKFDHQSYNVTVDSESGVNVSSVSDATHGTALVFNVSSASAFKVVITVNGAVITPNIAGAVYTVDGSDITGDIIITAKKAYEVVFDGTNGSITYTLNSSSSTPYPAEGLTVMTSDILILIPSPKPGYAYKASMDDGVTWSEETEFTVTGKILLKFEDAVYNVTKDAGEGITVTVESKATHGTDLVFTVAADFDVKVTVRVGGTEVTVTENNGEYTLEGSKITGNVSITAAEPSSSGDNTMIYVAAAAAVAAVALAAVYFVFIRKP